MKKLFPLLFACCFATSVYAQSLTGPTPNIGMGVCGVLKGANMNSTADQAIAINLPNGGANYLLNSIRVVNPSTSLTTVQGGMYTGAGKTGFNIVAATQYYSGLTTNAPNTANNQIGLTITNFVEHNANPVYLSLTTPQGAAATADIYIYCWPLP